MGSASKRSVDRSVDRRSRLFCFHLCNGGKRSGILASRYGDDSCCFCRTFHCLYRTHLWLEVLSLGSRRKQGNEESLRNLLIHHDLRLHGFDHDLFFIKTNYAFRSAPHLAALRFLYSALNSAIIAGMAEALYRKYRPETFKEVLGQDHIVSVLQDSIKMGNIAHAYLFSGTRGTGKTTMARILAREVHATENDVYEIDAASNRGIDDIRELRDAVDTLPFESPYKVYIIDEVHMLTKEAFNALLKTLEEPPGHALFILATTESEKLPETITSRCQTFTFKQPNQKILKDMVINVAKQEGFTLEPASADLIALLAEGSFRDAHGVLQKIIFSSKDKKISVEEVEQVTGAPPSELINNFIEAIDKKELNVGLESLNKAAESGIDMKVFLKLGLHKMRSVLLLRFAKNLESIIEEQFSKEDFTYLKKIAARKGSNINASTLAAFLDAYVKIGNTHIPQLPIELTLVSLLKEG